jgi:hypothetical protein
VRPIGNDYHAGVGTLQWVVDSYNLAYAVLLLTGGLLADLYGRRLVFMAATCRDNPEQAKTVPLSTHRKRPRDPAQLARGGYQSSAGLFLGNFTPQSRVAPFARASGVRPRGGVDLSRHDCSPSAVTCFVQAWSSDSQSVARYSCCRSPAGAAGWSWCRYRTAMKYVMAASTAPATAKPIMTSRGSSTEAAGCLSWYPIHVAF